MDKIIIIIIIIIIHSNNSVCECRPMSLLFQVFGLPDLGEKRHHQIPPQFMTELYNNIADQSGVTRRRNPYNAKVVRSFIERGKLLFNYRVRTMNFGRCN
jgi:hypothetical protein